MVYFSMKKKERVQAMKKKEVLLSVSGWSQGQDEEKEDTVRLLTTGFLSRQGEDWRIDYTETQDGNDAHDITLTMGRGVVMMQRKGPYQTSMVFEKGRRFEGSYVTPFGDLDMGIFSTKVRYSVDEAAEGEVQLQYQLDLQGQFAAMHELKIRFCPAHKA